MFTSATPARALLKTSELQTKQAVVSKWFQHLGLVGEHEAPSSIWSNVGDGVALCQLVQKLGFPPPRSPLQRHDQRLRNIDNISYFLQALPALGLPSHLIPVTEDILGFRSNAPDKKAKVVECLYALCRLTEAAQPLARKAVSMPVPSDRRSPADPPRRRLSLHDDHDSNVAGRRFTFDAHERSSLFFPSSSSSSSASPDALSPSDSLPTALIVVSQFVALLLIVVWLLVWLDVDLSLF